MKAENELIREIIEIRESLAVLSHKTEELLNQDGITWATVGSVQHAGNLIKEAINFLMEVKHV